MSSIKKGAKPLNKFSHADTALNEKLTDAMNPGYTVEFEPEEAERIGAFKEDALSEADALDSSLDATD